jgi:diguanylate cyclase (GGDEF)-like protein
MELWNKRILKSVLLPGGIIFLAGIVLLKTLWVPLSVTGINFFYDAVFVAAALLAWRFHATRVLFCVAVLLLAHYGISQITLPRTGMASSGRMAFDAIALLVPMNFALLTLLPERSSDRRKLYWFVVLLLFEATFVAVFSRPDQPEISVLHIAPIHRYHLRLSQPAFLFFMGALGFLIYRLGRYRKAIDHGMFWSLLAALVALETGAAGRLGTAYFGIAGFILASAVVENSYSLAYQDELTGLQSRRAFNDALLKLKHPFAIGAVDIDHFKNINDTYGHDTGDQVLRLVASRLARITSGGEPFRVGGEEFAILFPGRLRADVADHLELLRLEIEGSIFRIRTKEDRRKSAREMERRAPSARRTRALPLPESSTLSVTVSIGLADSYPGFTPDQVILQADKALYRAKQSGRNRLEIAGFPNKGRKKAPTGRSAQL